MGLLKEWFQGYKKLKCLVFFWFQGFKKFKDRLIFSDKDLKNFEGFDLGFDLILGFEFF